MSTSAEFPWCFVLEKPGPGLSQVPAKRGLTDQTMMLLPPLMLMVMLVELVLEVAASAGVVELVEVVAVVEAVVEVLVLDWDP